MRNGFDTSDAGQGMPDSAEKSHDADNWRFHETSVASRVAAGERGRGAGAGKLMVLLVDDDRRLCDGLSALLKVVGYGVVSVYSGGEALAAVEARNFDAAVIDVELPDMDGVDVLKALRGIDPDVGTLMLTGKDSLEQAVEALDLGADAFMLKPADPDLLISRLGKVARLKRLERGLRGAEAIYREIFGNIGDGFFQADLEGNFTAMNRTGAEILGFEGPERLLDGGLKTWETYFSRDEYEALMTRVLREGEVRRALRRCRRRDGSLGWLETTVRRRRNADGSIAGFEGVFRDASDRVRYQEVLEALHGLFADLGEAEAVGDIGKLAVEFLRRAIEINRASFVIADEGLLRYLGEELGDWEPYEQPTSGRSAASRAVRTGEVQMVPNTRRHKERVPKTTAADEGITSVLAVPVKIGGEVVAVIEIGSVRPDAYSDVDQKLVEIVVERVATALDRLLSSKLGLRSDVKLWDFM